MRTVAFALGTSLALYACKEKEYCWDCIQYTKVERYDTSNGVSIISTQHYQYEMLDTCELTETDITAFKADVDNWWDETRIVNGLEVGSKTYINLECTKNH